MNSKKAKRIRRALGIKGTLKDAPVSSLVQPSGATSDVCPEKAQYRSVKSVFKDGVQVPDVEVKKFGLDKDNDNV